LTFSLVLCPSSPFPSSLRLERILKFILKLLLGDPSARKLKRYQPTAFDINVLMEDIAPLSVENLREKTLTFKE